MNCTSLIITPKLREAMRKAGKLILFELPDLVLVEIPVEMQDTVQRFLNFDRSLDQFWSDYGRSTSLSGPFIRAARYSWDNFLLELRHAKLVKPELEVACFGSLQDEKDRTKLSEMLLALELRSKISRIDVRDWRQYLAEEVNSESVFRHPYDRLVCRLRGVLTKAAVWCGSASPIVNALRQNGCRVQVHYAVTYLKPPLAALLALARIRGLTNITDGEIEVGVKMHLQYLDYVITGENVDAAHGKWEEMIRSSIVRGI